MPLGINHGPRRPVSEDLRPIDADKFLRALFYDKTHDFEVQKQKKPPKSRPHGTAPSNFQEDVVCERHPQQVDVHKRADCELRSP